MLAVVFFLLTLNPEPIALDTLSVERARALDGQVVKVTMLIAKPTYTLLGYTAVGAADLPDEIERGAYLVGKRFDIDDGDRVTIVGTLRVVHHGPATVNRVLVPAWTERTVWELPKPKKGN